MRTVYIFICSLMIALHCSAQKINVVQEMNIKRNEMITSIKSMVENEMSKNKVVGMSVAIVDSCGVILSEGFGKADKENKIAADNSTLFPIASITKTFTGIAIMQLVEQGLIDLDEPIGNYIPELSLPNGEEKTITTRMLLTHHSGIHGDILYNWYLPTVSKDPLIYEQVVLLINEVGTIFPPGKLHSYSNAGYSLLGVLVHKVSGKSYVDYIHSNILTPLGMNNSIAFAGENTNCIIAKGYNGKDSTSMPMKLGIPAGGIVLSADDAAKYLMGIIGSYHGDNSLLKSETMKLMMTQQNSNIPLDKGFSIGLTWFLQDPINKVAKYAAHCGELPPYHSMMIVLPELKMGVFISINTNKAASVPDELAHKIIKYLYEYQTGNAIPQIKTENKISLSSEQLKQYEGIYPNVYFGPMSVKLKGKKLLIKSPVMPTPLVLIPHADTTFTVKAKMLGFTFSVKQLDALKVEFRENEGERYMYFIIQNSMLNPNLEFEPVAIPQEYSMYKGSYKVINMENSDRVVKDVKIRSIKKGKYFLLTDTFLGRHKFNFVLNPINKDNARIAGVGYFLGEKIQWKTSENRIFMYWSGLVFEKVK